MRYSENVSDVMGDMGQQISNDEERDSLTKRVKEFKRLLTESPDEHCDSITYYLKCCLLNQMMEDKRKFGTLSVSDTCIHEHFNVHIKPA